MSGVIRLDRIAQSKSDLATAEAEGIVADSKSVRLALMQKFHSGECTLEQVQAELASIQKSASKNGMITRNQAYMRRR